jgi:hypothetical protein
MDHHASLLLVAAWICGAAIGFLIGFAAGRFHFARAFRHEVLDMAETETLGTMLTEGQKADYALAYKEPAAVARQMNDITYAVPNVLTPFVGTGPKPGRNGNAVVNAMQFRATTELSQPKPLDIYRIFLTGGSTAFGSGAPSQETTPGARLEMLLNEKRHLPEGKRCEVFVLANPAWASTHERIVIENRLSELEPDMVISLSGTNDAHWAAAGRNVFWFRTYSDQHCWNLLNLARRAGGLDAMPEVETVENPAEISPESVAARLAKNVQLSATALRLKGARYVFALQPMIALTTKVLSTREEQIRAVLQPPGVDHFLRCYAAMKRSLSNEAGPDFSFLDLSDVFAGLTPSDEIFLDSYHFGDRGNAILANAIAQGIGPLIAAQLS